MLLMPKKQKFRKTFKGRIHGHATQGNSLIFAAYGLQAVEPDRISAKQIEASRRAINRCMRRLGRTWIRTFPDVPVTSKPAEVRMGKGKGSVDRWVCRVKPGRVIFEVDASSPEIAREALLLAARKLPIKTRFISRELRGG